MHYFCISHVWVHGKRSGWNRRNLYICSLLIKGSSSLLLMGWICSSSLHCRMACRVRLQLLGHMLACRQQPVSLTSDTASALESGGEAREMRVGWGQKCTSGVGGSLGLQLKRNAIIGAVSVAQPRSTACRLCHNQQARQAVTQSCCACYEADVCQRALPWEPQPANDVGGAQAPLAPPSAMHLLITGTSWPGS